MEQRKKKIYATTLALLSTQLLLAAAPAQNVEAAKAKAPATTQVAKAKASKLDPILKNYSIDKGAQVKSPKYNIYVKPWNTKGANLVGSLSKYNGKQLHLGWEATTKSGTYVRVEYKGKIIGYAPKKAFSLFDAMEVEFSNEAYPAKIKADRNVYSAPWNTKAGIKKLGTLKKYDEPGLVITQVVSTRTGEYAQLAILNGTTKTVKGWTALNAFYDVKLSDETVNIENVDIVKDRIYYDAVWNTQETVAKLGYVSKFQDSKIDISRLITTRSGDYVAFTVGGSTYFTAANAFNIKGEYDRVLKTASYNAGVAIADEKYNVYSKPWNSEAGIKLLGSIAEHNKKELYVTNTKTTSSGTYALLHEDNAAGKEIGWVALNALRKLDTVSGTVNAGPDKATILNDFNVYPSPWNTKSVNPVLGKISSFTLATGEDYYVTKVSTTSAGTKYAEFGIGTTAAAAGSNIIGWTADNNFNHGDNGVRSDVSANDTFGEILIDSAKLFDKAIDTVSDNPNLGTVYAFRNSKKVTITRKVTSNNGVVSYEIKENSIRKGFVQADAIKVFDKADTVSASTPGSIKILDATARICDVPFNTIKDVVDKGALSELSTLQVQSLKRTNQQIVVRNPYTLEILKTYQEIQDTSGAIGYVDSSAIADN